MTCVLGILANGADVTVAIRVTPTSEGNLSNTVQVAGNETDPEMSNRASVAANEPDPNGTNNIAT